MDESLWPVEWQRGILELAVLAAIASESGPTYGYRIVQSIETAGFGKIKGGTLYPILGRIEVAGLISTRWGEGEGGPGRKFIELTNQGREHLAELQARWSTFTAAVDRLIGAE